jgi:hypothetical protein
VKTNKMSQPAIKRMVDQRRKQENMYRDMDSVIVDNKKQLQKAKFEIMTSAKIEKRIEKVY